MNARLNNFSRPHMLTELEIGRRSGLDSAAENTGPSATGGASGAGTIDAHLLQIAGSLRTILS